MTDKGFINTGNSVVDIVGEMDFSGNVTPKSWYRWIVQKNGRPYHLAIAILGEIVYWYRPMAIKDEESGETIGYRKRFKDDWLQKSYEDLAKKFFESRKTIKRAVDALVDFGVIRREFRTVTADPESKKKMNNVMYLLLVPEALDRITDRISGDDERTPADKSGNTPVDKPGTTLLTILEGASGQPGDEAPAKSVRTNTKNNTENTNKEYFSPVFPAGLKEVPATGSGRAIREMDEERACREMIAENIGYDEARKQLTGEELACYDEIYELICDTVCHAKGTIRINRKDMPADQVKGVFEKLTGEHIEFVMRSMKEKAGAVRDMRAYLLTVLFRANQTMHSCKAWGNHPERESGCSYYDRGGGTRPGSNWDIARSDVDYDALFG